jgi:hypothetical protein
MQNEHFKGSHIHSNPNHSAQEETSEYPMVCVTWKDAESQGGPSWEDSSEMLEFAKKPLVLVRTVGLLIHSDDEKVAVTDTVSGDQMGGVNKIPKSWIMEITQLEPQTSSEPSEHTHSSHSRNPRRSVG